MKFPYILVFCSLFVCHFALSGQAGFRGSAIIGLNLAQLDGDELVGFNKTGVTSGVKVAFDLKKKVEANVEILFSQRGSSENLFRKDTSAVTKINYFELPIYLSFKDWYIENEDYYKMRGQIGFSTGFLANSSVENTTDFDPSLFNDLDFSWILGASYSFTKHWSLTARYNRSINKLLEDDNLRINFLLSYFWSLRAEYNF